MSARDDRLGAGPPAFLGLAGHPVRWRLLAELARSDRLVDELVDAVEQPQALVSYHLGKLRVGGLVAARRSANDGRAVFYRLDLDRCGASLVAAGASLHPGLAVVAPESPDLAGGVAPRVLFVCTGNSARSQIAEALLRRSSDGAVHVRSAGSDPKPVHRFALEVLVARGIDTSACRSKSLDEFAGERFDVVVTLCDKVRERCPEFDGDERVHWSVDDPTSPVGGRVTRVRFERLTHDLEHRIRWLHASLGTPPLHRRNTT